MATTMQPTRPRIVRRRTLPRRRRQGLGLTGVKFITRSTGRKILDRQARKYLGMSGEEFTRRYRAGETEDLDHSDVVRISMLIPFAEP